MIPVTKPFLPPVEEFYNLTKGIWQRQWLTNNGPLVNELELRLKQYLDVNHLLFMGNGTVAIQIALKALGLKGNVITTPFTYVATASSIVWEGCSPRFVDIDVETFNMDPGLIEDAIDSDTSGILATHVFGNPCDVEQIERIARKAGIPVIYDAAHCFGTKYKGRSVFSCGDIAATSFHATKIFNTAEGGAVFTSNPELLKKMAYLRNFGHDGPADFAEAGTNGKNSEFHAALGLANLKYVDDVLKNRKSLSEAYTSKLSHAHIQRQKIQADSEFNFAYYPVLFESEQMVTKVNDALKAHEIFPRRYFYPSLNTVDVYKGPTLPVSEDISRRILCLPLYFGLSEEEVSYITRIILRTIAY